MPNPLQVCSRCRAKTIPVIGITTINVAAGNPVYYQVPQKQIPDAGRYTISTLPTGLSFDQSTGIISGRVTSLSIATYTINLSASNVRGVGYGTVIINVLNVNVSINFRYGGGQNVSLLQSLQVSWDGNNYIDVASIGDSSGKGAIYSAISQLKYKIIYAPGTYAYGSFACPLIVEVALPAGAQTLLRGSQTSFSGNLLSFNTLTLNANNATALSLVKTTDTSTEGIKLINAIGGIAYGINGGYNNSTKDSPGAITQAVSFSQLVDLEGYPLFSSNFGDTTKGILELVSDGDSQGNWIVGYDAVGAPAQQIISETIINF